jgi:hypothetical protein
MNHDDMAGRVMAHAFNDELEKIAGFAPHKVRAAFAKRYADTAAAPAALQPAIEARTAKSAQNMFSNSRYLQNRAGRKAQHALTGPMGGGTKARISKATRLQSSADDYGHIAGDLLFDPKQNVKF